MRQRFVVQVLDDSASQVPKSGSTGGFSSNSALPLPVEPPRPVSNHRHYARTEVYEPEKHVEKLLVEAQLEESREVTVIAKPPLARKVEESPKQATNSLENAFLSQAPLLPPTERIESVYRQMQKVTTTNSPSSSKTTPWTYLANMVGQWKLPMFSRGSSPAFSQAPKTWKQRALGLGIGATGMIVVGSTAGGFWLMNDIKHTYDQALLLKTDVMNGQLTSARERLEFIHQRQDSYELWYGWGRTPIRLVLGAKKGDHIDKLFSLSDKGLQIVDNGLQTYAVVETGYKQFLGKQDGEAIPTLQQATGNLEALYTNISHFQAEINASENPFEISLLDDVKKTVNSQAPEIRKGVLAAQQLSFVLPEILGQTGKKQYLVLLQNNAELRPTGGFIGSFGILTVQDGKFVDFRVEDVYEADGQLNGYVAPPEEIVAHLGEAQWYLRDVNWSPDFPTVSAQAGWFLDKTIRIKPDGVIGINLDVAKKLLKVTGPIQLVDYQEVVTSENLYERAQMHAEMNFFAGSTQKKDFLSAVANTLFDKLMAEDSNKFALLKAFYESAQQSQLLISLNNPQAQQAFSNLGWSGAVLTPNCPAPFAGKGCFVDTVMQVEANVGVNKANQHMKRSIEQKTVLQNGKAEHTRTIDLQNLADSNAWPEGAYKVYNRLFVPVNAELVKITINGQELSPTQILNKEEKETGKRSFGFLANVPVKTTTQIVIQYSVPIPTDKQQVYAFFEQKQSGTGGDAVVHKLVAPTQQVLSVAPEPQIEDRTLTFTSQRMTHDFYAVELR